MANKHFKGSMRVYLDHVNLYETESSPVNILSTLTNERRPIKNLTRFFGDFLDKKLRQRIMKKPRKYKAKMVIYIKPEYWYKHNNGDELLKPKYEYSAEYTEKPDRIELTRFMVAMGRDCLMQHRTYEIDYQSSFVEFGL